MRQTSVVNWTLLCLNALLFVFLLLTLLVSSGWPGLSPPARPLPPGLAGTLGMEVYWQKGPLVLWTAKDFPRSGSFMLSQSGGAVSMSVQELSESLSDGGATQSAMLNVGEDFSLSCDYSVVGGGVRIQECKLLHRKEGLLEALTDHNADGVFDLRQTRDEQRHGSHVCVLYRGSWREVMGGDEDPEQDSLHKQLVEGDRVSFDMQSGQWLSATDKPAASKDEAAHQEGEGISGLTD